MFNIKCSGDTAVWGTGSLDGIATWRPGDQSRLLWSVPNKQTIANFAASPSWVVVTTVAAEQGYSASGWTLYAVNRASGRGHVLAQRAASNVAVPTPTIFGSVAVWDLAASNSLMSVDLSGAASPRRLAVPSQMQPVRPFFVDARTLLFQDAAQDPDLAHEGSYIRGGPEYRFDLTNNAATPLATGNSAHFVEYGDGTLVWVEQKDVSVHALDVATNRRYDLGPGRPPAYASQGIVVYRSADVSTHHMLLVHLGTAGADTLPDEVDATTPLALCDGHLFIPNGDKQVVELLVH